MAMTTKRGSALTATANDTTVSPAAHRLYLRVLFPRRRRRARFVRVLTWNWRNVCVYVHTFAHTNCMFVCVCLYVDLGEWMFLCMLYMRACSLLTKNEKTI